MSTTVLAVHFATTGDACSKELRGVAFGSGIDSESGERSFARDGGDKDDIAPAGSFEQRVCHLGEMIG